MLSDLITKLYLKHLEKKMKNEEVAVQKKTQGINISKVGVYSRYQKAGTRSFSQSVSIIN